MLPFESELDRNFESLAAEVGAECFDKGAFSRTRHARYPYPHRFAAVRQYLLYYLLAEFKVFWRVALDHGYRP